MTCPHAADRPGPDNSQPQHFGPATRYAVRAGPLTLTQLQERLAIAAARCRESLEGFSDVEQLHLRLIRKTLAPGSTWRDVLAAVDTVARPA